MGDRRFFAAVCEDEVELLDLTKRIISSIEVQRENLEFVDREANDDTLRDSLSSLSQLPMFESGILLLLRFTKISEDDASLLIDAMDHSYDSNYLVIATTKNLPRSLSKYLKDHGVIENSEIGKKGAEYAAKCFAESPLMISVEARSAIVGALGEDYSMLPSLLNTLETAFSPDTKITAGDIRPFLHEIEDLAPWSLPDLVVQGKTKEALELLGKLERTQMAFPIITAVLNRRFIELAALSSPTLNSIEARTDAYRRGTGQSPKAPPFVVEKLWRDAVKFNTGAFANVFGILGELERSLRGASGLESFVSLELAVARLAALCATVQKRKTTSKR